MLPPLDTLDRCLDALRARCREGGLHARLAALRLAARAAIPALADALLAVVDDRDVDARLCAAALAALARAEVAVPAARFRELLGEAAGSLHCRAEPDAAPPLSASAVLCAARSPELVELTLAWVEGLSPRAVVKLLDSVVVNEDEPAAPLLDALIERWSAEAPEAPEARDVWLAARLAGRHDDALALLARHWRAEVLAGRGGGVAEAIEGAPDLWPLLRDLPGVRERAEAELLGPTGALADALGAAPFARRLRNAVLRWSAHARTPGLDRDAALEARYYRAVRHLRVWSHGTAVAASLLRGAALAPEVEEALLAVWRARDGGAARAWLASLGDRARLARLACALSHGATADDLPLLDLALDLGDEGQRVTALGAIARLRSGPHHVAAMRAFAAAGGALGDAARWRLVRMGDRETIEAVLAAAYGAATAAERRVAFASLSWRPEVMRAHRAAVEAAIDGGGDEGFAAGALIVGLSHALGDDARGWLLRLFLTAPHWVVREEAAVQLAERGMLLPTARRA